MPAFPDLPAMQEKETAEEIKLRHFLAGINKKLQDAPSSASWYRKLFDGLGEMSAQTSMFLLTRGAGTFLATTEDRRTELLAAGAGELNSLLRGMASGAIEVGVERIGGESLGKTIRQLGTKIPAFNKMGAYFGGHIDALKHSVWARPWARYSTYSLTAGASELAEEIITPLLNYPVDNIIAGTAGVRGETGMSWDDVLTQLGEVCDPLTAAQMLVFGAVCAGAQVPSMVSQAEFVAAGKEKIAAITGAPLEKAEQIAAIVSPEEKITAIKEAWGEYGKERTKQATLDAWKKYLVESPEAVATFLNLDVYKAQVEQFNLPRLEPLENGNYRLTNRDPETQEESSEEVTFEQAREILNAKINTSLIDDIVKDQTTIATSKLVERIKETNSNIEFEELDEVVTLDSIRKLAEQANLFLAENPETNLDSQATAIGTKLTFQQVLDQEKNFTGRTQTEKAQDESVQDLGADSFQSAAHWVRMKNGNALIRYAKKEATPQQLLEEVIEINYATMNMYGGKSHVWHVNNLRALDEWMTKNGFQEKHQHLLARNGDVTANDVMEAYSKLALSEFMQKAHTITHLPTWLRNFVNMVRTWLHTAASLIRLGDGLASLTKQAQEGKLAPDSGISPDLLENVHTLTNSLRTLWLEKGIEQGTQEAEQITATSTTSTTTAGYQGFLNLSNKEKAEARQKLTLTTTPIEKGAKTKTIVQILRDKFVGKQLICINSDIVGGVSRKDCEKMVSKKAVDKSMANSFTFAQHVTAAQGIDELYKYAFRLGEFNDRDNNPHVLSINRFLTPIQIAGQTSTALITVKQTTSDKLYSVELCQLKDLDGISERLSHLYRTGDKIKRPVANIPASRSLDEGIAEFRNYVKEVFPEAATQINGISGGHSMNVEVPPDKTLVVAHTLSTYKAQDALSLGFAPHPSVAITNVNSFYDWNCPEHSVTFLAGREFIDPAISPADIYRRDAWTGVMPPLKAELRNPQYILDLAWDLEQVAKEQGFFDKIELTLHRARNYVNGGLGFRSDDDLRPLLHAYFCFVEKEQDYDEITKEQYYNDEAYWKIYCDAQPDYPKWEKDRLSAIRGFKFYSAVTEKNEFATPVNLHEHMLKDKRKGNEIDSTDPTFHRFTVMANPEYQSVEEVQKQRNNIRPDKISHIRLERCYNDAEYELRKFLNRAAKLFPNARDLDSDQLVHDLLIDDVSKGYEVDDYSIYHQLVDLCGAKAADGVDREEFDDLNPNDACEAIARLAKLALTVPTRYMEAVPRRSVKFSEFQTAVVSARTAETAPLLMSQLQELGIEIKVFDQTDKDAFINAVKEFALDYGFSADAVEGATKSSSKPVDEYKTFHVSEGRQKLLKGTLDLYDGYVINEFEHGEFADLLSLGHFILGLPIAKTKSNTFVIENKKLKDLATEIAEYYDKAGIHALNIAPLGEVIIDKTGVENSIGHFTRNAKTSKEHKQRVCDAFALVPDVLERGVLVEYGTQVDNPQLRSYLYAAPVIIGDNTTVMAVRVRTHAEQTNRFYLHGVALLDDLKQKALEPAAVQRVGLVTDTLTGADPRDVLRVVKKALAVKIQFSPHTWGFF